jgi:CMP-N-acetylneuraminic acid synthetase
MKIVAFVPIKLNSQRLPNKMMLPLGEKKLFQYIFDVLLDVKKVIDIDIYCFCSDEKIKDCLNEKIIFCKRDKLLDEDKVKGIDIYRSFVDNINADIYVLCHATSPFIKKESIISGINALIMENNDSSFAVSKIKTFCWYNNKTLNYNLSNIVRTQDIEPIYHETSAFYIFKKYILTEYSQRIGFNSKMIITDRIESIDIDELEDYELAVKIIK